MIIDKYNQRAEKINSLVCVGLDSEFSKLPERFKKMENPQFEFNKWIIDQTAQYAACFKPNIAFYEARGEQGMKELKLTMEYLQKNYPDIFTICDAKRGDIGNTNNQYAVGIFDYFGFDAITMQPYLGMEALQNFTDRKDKLTLILVRTSNPGAGEIQDLVVQARGLPLWQVVAEKVSKEWNKNNNFGMVMGATYPEEIKLARQIDPEMIFLVPGVGAQSGSLQETLKAGLNKDKKGLMINSSRGIIFAENPKEEAKKLRDEINKYR